MLNPQLSQHLELFEESADRSLEEDEDERVAASSFSSKLHHGGQQSLWFSIRTIPFLLLAPYVACAGVALSSSTMGYPYVSGDRLVFGGALAGLFFATVTAFRLLRHAQMAARKRTTAESRLCISKLLGSIGSPMLLSSTTSVIPKSRDLLCLAEQMSKAHVEWIKTFDQVVQVLQRTTSLRLGINSQSVGRVERASLGRLARRKKNDVGRQNNSSVEAPVTLLTLRKRLFESMHHYNITLMSAAGLSERAYETTSSLNGVVTLSLLQSMRCEAMDLASSVLDSFYTTVQDTLLLQKQILLGMESSKQAASEACCYFSSFLQSSTPAASDQLGPYNIEKEIGRMKEELGFLLSTLNGCSAMLSCDDESTFDEQEFLIYWKEFRELLDKLQSFAKCVDNDLGQANGNFVEKENKSLPNNPEGCGQSTIKVPEGEEYAVDSPASDNGTSEQFQVVQDRVLVYAGKGSNSIQARTAVPRPSRTESELPIVSATTEHQLMEELKNHMLALPRWQEVVATPATDQTDGSVESEEESTQDHQVGCQTHEFFRQSDHAQSFLLELSESIKAERTIDEDVRCSEGRD